MIACIISSWVGLGSNNDPFRSLIVDVYNDLAYMDYTGQPVSNIIPDPNLFVAEIQCDAATLAAIEADERFCVLEVEE